MTDGMALGEVMRGGKLDAGHWKLCEVCSTTEQRTWAGQIARMGREGSKSKGLQLAHCIPLGLLQGAKESIRHTQH